MKSDGNFQQTSNDYSDNRQTAQMLAAKLEELGVVAEFTDFSVSATFTRYEFKVQSSKIPPRDLNDYADKLGLSVGSRFDLMISTPDGNDKTLYVDVPNEVRQSVDLLPLMMTDEDFNNAQGELVFAIGRDAYNQAVYADLAKMPHLIIGGATGAGKSACLHSLILSIMYRYSPDHVRFILADTKRVEFSDYEGLPHNLIPNTLCEANDVLGAADYLIAEMDRRYTLFSQSCVTRITDYNKKSDPSLRLPYIVFVVDELADIMFTHKKDFESRCIRLMQKSRAAGIHVVLATQVPSLTVLTGSIRANVPCRIGLKVCSPFDSITVLGSKGAEYLLGRGDMLYYNGMDFSAPQRVQGTYIDRSQLVTFAHCLSQENESVYDESAASKIKEYSSALTADKSDQISKRETYYKKALRYWLEHTDGKASLASLQRGLNIGFNRAGRIIEDLQLLGYVEERTDNFSVNQPLKVLVTLDELDALFPDADD